MSWDETDLINKADINIYKELIKIDEKLGTKTTEQLFKCAGHSFRKDLFKVLENFFLFFKNSLSRFSIWIRLILD